MPGDLRVLSKWRHPEIRKKETIPHRILCNNPNADPRCSVHLVQPVSVYRSGGGLRSDIWIRPGIGTMLLFVPDRYSSSDWSGDLYTYYLVVCHIGWVDLPMDLLEVWLNIPVRSVYYHLDDGITVRDICSHRNQRQNIKTDLERNGNR